MEYFHFCISEIPRPRLGPLGYTYLMRKYASITWEFFFALHTFFETMQWLSEESKRRGRILIQTEFDYIIHKHTTYQSSKISSKAIDYFET